MNKRGFRSHEKIQNGKGHHPSSVAANPSILRVKGFRDDLTFLWNISGFEIIKGLPLSLPLSYGIHYVVICSSYVAICSSSMLYAIMIQLSYTKSHLWNILETSWQQMGKCSDACVGWAHMPNSACSRGLRVVRVERQGRREVLFRGPWRRVECG